MNDPVIVEQHRELEIMAESDGTSTADLARADLKTQPETDSPAALLPPADSGAFRKRWDQIQTEFVDDPRGSVEKADRLVADTIKRVAEVFAEQRNRLEREWERTESASTEDLRQALRRYRSFFDRLLSAGADRQPVR